MTRSIIIIIHYSIINHSSIPNRVKKHQAGTALRCFYREDTEDCRHDALLTLSFMRFTTRQEF